MARRVASPLGRVVLHPSAITGFFESDPRIAALVEREAMRIFFAMREDVKSYFVGAETGVEDDVGLAMDGNRAIVALLDDPDGHSKHAPNTKSSRYARVGRWEITREVAAGRRR